MKTILVLRGLPSSGKSSWAREFVMNEPGWKRINKDDLRAMLDNSVYSKSNESLIHSTQQTLLEEFLVRNFNVIIDNTNLSSSCYHDACKVAAKVGDVVVKTKTFNCGVEECVRRDSYRKGKAHVGKDVIEKFNKRFLRNGFSEELETYFPVVKQVFPVIEQDEALPSVVVCDLDGCLSIFNRKYKDGSIDEVYKNVQARRPYHCEIADNDGINLPVLDVIRWAYNDGINIIFLSGRQEKFREPTEIFLNKYVAPYIKDYKLLMRTTADMRSDEIIKTELYEANIKDKYNVRFVLDDRSGVVKNWRKLGLICFQVAFGDF